MESEGETDEKDLINLVNNSLVDSNLYTLKETRYFYIVIIGGFSSNVVRSNTGILV